MIRTSPLISVIIPVYNAEKTLVKCIESVLMQDVTDFELILVDDGSKDSSGDICNRYAAKDSRVRVIHKKNGGVSSARNRGLEVASGEWITFVDSDDSIGENFFHDVEAAHEDLLIRGYFMHSMQGKEVERLVLDDFDALPDMTLFINRFIGNNILRGPVAKFFRSRLIGDLRFPEDMKVGEDTWFVWKYLSGVSTCRILYYYYYYYLTTGGPSEVKYKSTTDYAVHSLLHLREAFEPMSEKHAISPSQFLQFIGYFKCVSKGDWQNNPNRWYGNAEVKSLYRYVWPALNWGQRCRLLAAKFLGR